MTKNQYDELDELNKKYSIRNKTGTISLKKVEETILKMTKEIESLNSFKIFIEHAPFNSGDVLLIKNSGEKVLYKNVGFDFNENNVAKINKVNAINKYGETISLNLDEVTLYNFTSSVLVEK